ncbi:hypothetical protein E3N88_43149 [Mikania micrantha]|uniref:Yippee domain-containing protein n=1 Tax=Mikania micrantha TaxID=192012 RepID=A0A5N6LFN8_9ASTR|nr:hypothetical protein E3N88_43149 [Mikania micrantha]
MSPKASISLKKPSKFVKHSYENGEFVKKREEDKEVKIESKGDPSLSWIDNNQSEERCRQRGEESSNRIGEAFQCKHGKAYLFSKVVNVTVGVKEDRLMMTGLHTVADIFCVKCGSIVGWTYETAHDKNQKYKEGKSVLERFKLDGPDGSSYWVSHEAQIAGSDQDDV